MPLELVLPLILFLAPLAYSPGPGNLFFATLGARSGVSGTVSALIGYHIVTVAVTAAIGYGFAAGQMLGPHIMRGMQVTGALYVLWLAWCISRPAVGSALPEARRAGLSQGGLLLLLNPKAYLIITLMFTQFPPENALRLWAITGLFTLNNLIAFALWALIGERLMAQFGTPATARVPNLIFAAMLACVALWMLA